MQKRVVMARAGHFKIDTEIGITLAGTSNLFCKILLSFIFQIPGKPIGQRVERMSPSDEMITFETPYSFIPPPFHTI